jgi:stage IV sporulation protein FB
MNWSLQITAVRGIPVRIHATFVLLLVLLFARTAITSGPRVAVIELAVVLALFVCVVLHELGHAAVALWHGIPITSITLYPFGGVARLGTRFVRGQVELRIALAGPIVNLALAAIVWLAAAGRVLGPWPAPAQQLLAVLFWANLMLAAFNLLPAFPLDGGRVLRGALEPSLGRVRATVWAASLGQIAAVLAIGVGLFHQWWLILAGVLILPSANAELRHALALRQLQTRRVADVMVTRLQHAAPDEPINAVLDRSRAAPMDEFIVVDSGACVGYLPAARIWSLASEGSAPERLAGDAALRVGADLEPDTSLAAALEHLTDAGAEAAPVRGEEGRILGIVTRSGLLRSLTLMRVLSERG